jgi:hypothetical protein
MAGHSLDLIQNMQADAFFDRPTRVLKIYLVPSYLVRNGSIVICGFEPPSANQ